MKVFYIEEFFKEAHTAATKAPDDINFIMSQMGFSKITLGLKAEFSNPIFRKLALILSYAKFLLLISYIFRRGDSIVMHFPFVTKRLVKKVLLFICKIKGVRLIFLIHDLDSIRRSIDSLDKREITLSNSEKLILRADKVICHNYRMKEYLVSQGVDTNKIIELEIFDYINPDVCVSSPEIKDLTNFSLAVAGNLIISKSGYIYKYLYETQHVFLNIYGPNFNDDEKFKNYKYHGSFPPNVLPSKLNGCFGLVWDGPDIHTCSGNVGEYLIYNNPHKTSLFLSSNLPIVIWSKAALAKFIIDYGVGFTVDSLLDIEEKLQNMTLDEYHMMCKNTLNISNKLRSGFFTKKAILKALEQ